MTWYPQLERWAKQQMAEAPFEPKAIITPTAFSGRSLRRRLAANLAADGLPLAGFRFVTPNSLDQLYDLRFPRRSSFELRLRLAADFGAIPQLLGGRGERPWRDQLRLAESLLRDDAEHLSDERLNEVLDGRPRLRRFLHRLRAVAADMDGTAPLDAMDKANPGVHRVFSLPMPHVPQRLGVLIDRLDPVRCEPDQADEVAWLAALRPEQLAESVANDIVDGQRVAIVCMNSALLGPMSRSLDAIGLPWMSPIRRGEGSAKALRWLRQSPLSERRDQQPIGDWLALLNDAPKDLDEGIAALKRFGSVRIAGSAVVDLLADQSNRQRPYLGWPSGNIHLLGPGAWPDDSYDVVHLAGAQRGSLDKALGDHSPLLSFEDRQRLGLLDLLSFDMTRSGQRRGRWLAAWCAAATRVVPSWWARDASDMELVPDRWAKNLAQGHQPIELVVPAFGEAPAPTVSPASVVVEPKRWSPSLVETFHRCPRRALLQRLLKLDTDDLVEGLERYSGALWRGTMLHKIVELAAQECADDPTAMPQALQRVAETALRSEPVPERLIAPLKQSLMAQLKPLAERFESGAFKAVIGTEVDLTDDSGLFARCDLILRDASGRKVLVDLKTGAAKNAKAIAKAEREGTSTQRGLYLKLCPDASGSALLYLEPGDAGLQMVDGPEAADSLERAEEALAAAKSFVQRGAYPALPSNKQNECTYCDHRAACRPLDPAWIDRTIALEDQA